jgi:hypothetical protein
MPTSIRSALRKGGIAVLGGTLLAAGLAVSPAAQAHDEPDKTAKAIGATWLNGRLGDGLLHAAYDGGSGPVSYVDYGGTVEAAYALDAVGRTRLLPTITDALAGSVDSYITGADFGSPDDTYAGPTGKLLAFVSDFGGDADPSAFGGKDLVALMESMTTDSGDDAGRIVDDSAFDYGNVYGQIWAARGLLGAGSAEGAAAVDFLLTQQCADGYFLSFFSDSCDTAAPGPDAAAFAVILLREYADTHPELAAALDLATDWLVDWQADRGSLADDNGVANANSTGLGGWVFGLEGREVAARKAAIWLRALQSPGRTCDRALHPEKGAIAYNRAAYADGKDDGIPALAASQWQTVAVQALPALAHAPAAHVDLALNVPDRVDAGGYARVRVHGLAPGERACVGINYRLKTVIGVRGDDAVVVRIPVPKRTGERDVRLLTANHSVRVPTIAN